MQHGGTGTWMQVPLSPLRCARLLPSHGGLQPVCEPTRLWVGTVGPGRGRVPGEGQLGLVP